MWLMDRCMLLKLSGNDPKSDSASEPLHRFYFPEPIIEALFDRPLYKEIISSEPFRRLADVSFLGALDYSHLGYRKFEHKNTRYQHSLGVASLALYASSMLSLSVAEQDLFVAAALLHDIGHPPLSHSIESAYRDLLRMDHHSASVGIINGDNAVFGERVPGILKKYGIDPEVVISLIAGETNFEWGWLFSGPINIDTLDGILRARRYLKNDAFLRPEAVVDSLLVPGSINLSKADDFWNEKDLVYSHFINSERCFLLDQSARHYVSFRFNRELDSRDAIYGFLSTESAYKEVFKDLFNFIYLVDGLYLARDRAQFFEEQFSRRGKAIMRRLLDECEFLTKRRFFIDITHPIRAPSDLSRRYKKRRETTDFSFIIDGDREISSHRQGPRLL